MVARILELSRDPRLQRVGDFALAGVLLVGALIDLFHGGAGSGWSGWRPLEVAVAVGISVPLLWRRSHPAVTLWIVLVSGAVGAALVAPRQAGFEPFVALVVAYYSLGANADRRTSTLNVTGTLLVSAVGGVITVAAGEEKMGNTLPILVWTFAAWLIGRIIRSWRSRAAELEQLNQLLEDQWEVQAQAAVAVERGRIARELHDVIAHNISMIVVQAGAAARVLEGDQPEVTKALAAIEATGRQTVDEMRGLLGVLRRTDDGLALAPQPGLDDLGALVTQVHEAGLDVELKIEGPPVALPAGIDLSAYRVVQEALTNSLKHAKGAQARVTVRYSKTAVEIEIHDDGQTGANGNGTGGGHGLIGMRERVALWGGALTAGRGDTGWTVNARLPISGDQ
jgi:signal transduction histidine kinase